MEQWNVAEFEMTSSQEYENPYYTIDVDVIFIGPAGESILRPAFWKGENRWGVRFAPISIGTWTYSVSSSNPEDDLNNVTGSLECTEYTGNKEIFKRGFLKTMDGKQTLFYADGTPFFWLGDTHWQFLVDERYDESNKEGFDSQFRGIIDRRIEQGFTVYQSCMIGNNRVEDESDARGFFIPNTTFTEINLDFFANEVDRKMAYIVNSGLVNCMSFAWNYFLEQDYVQQMKRFARYVVGRYGAYPMVWSIVGEAAGYYATEEITLARWREVAMEVYRIDGYHQIRTVHMTNNRPLPDYYVGEEWHDFVLGQMGHGGMSLNVSYYAEFFEKHPNTPYIEGEAMYDGLRSDEYAARRYVSGQMVRNAAYRAMQNGCQGYGYGAQGIWNALWDSEEMDPESIFAFWGNQDWRTAIDSEVANQMTHFKSFYQSIGWQDLRPRNELGARTGVKNISANDTLTTIVIYIPDMFSALPQIGELSAGSYLVRLFDTRTGEYVYNETVELVTNGSISFPQIPDSTMDWAVVIHKQDN